MPALSEANQQHVENPGLSLLDLEAVSGFTREELGFALWYLCEKGYARADDHTRYGIMAAGVDFVESKLADDQSGLRVIASVQIPNQTDALSPMVRF